jgi:hypothetical protein
MFGVLVDVLVSTDVTNVGEITRLAGREEVS